MRDVFAGVIALVLMLVAVSLATRLWELRRHRRRVRETARSHGRAIIAEVPVEDDFVLFAEDDTHFYYGSRAIDKGLITAVRLLVNGAAIASSRVTRRATKSPAQIEGHADDIVHDRWDVAIETGDATSFVECGALRDGVSQEFAQAVFEAVKRELERRDTNRHDDETRHTGTKDTET